jgi:hypothetical protein
MGELFIGGGLFFGFGGERKKSHLRAKLFFTKLNI